MLPCLWMLDLLILQWKVRRPLIAFFELKNCIYYVAKYTCIMFNDLHSGL